MNNWLCILSWVCLIPSTLLLILKLYWTGEYAGSLQQQLDRIHGKQASWSIGVEVILIALAGSFLISRYFM